MNRKVIIFLYIKSLILINTENLWILKYFLSTYKLTQRRIKLLELLMTESGLALRPVLTIMDIVMAVGTTR